jgi:hypothetical protein
VRAPAGGEARPTRRAYLSAMAKNRPGSSKQALKQQEAALRRGAPGRRFVGDARPQREEALRAEREKVHRMAEIDGARRVAERVGIPTIAMLADLAQSAVRIGGALVRAPFLLARAFLRPHAA